MGAELRYPDLGAVVYPSTVPNGVADELPGLYGSLFSTLDWFEAKDKVSPTGACILEEPRHVLLFYRDGDTVEILNKEFLIAPGDVERACRALFRAFPHTRRVHLEILFPSEELHLPARTLYGVDHLVIDLPASAEDYTASLGKKTRQQVRRSRRNIERELGPITVETVSPALDAEEHMALLMRWKDQRFNAMGQTTMWQEDPSVAAYLTELLRRRGQVRIASIAGAPAAMQLLFPVGTSMYVVQSAFDPEYSPYGLGLLQSYDVVCESITEGYRRLSLLWGAPGHKVHLGVRPQRATRVSVFPSQAARLRFPGEAREILVRYLRREGQARYWRARHAIRRALTPGRRERDDESGRRQAPAAAAIVLSDLGAVVHPRVDPQEYAAELDRLYSSLFATVDWFETHDDPAWVGACVLEQPRHVLLFTGKGNTIRVLNKAFPIAPADAERACRAFFKVFTHVRRIHLEVLFPPSELRLPRRVLYSTVHMIVDLPETQEAYLASLSKRMRKHLRTYRNRLDHDFSEVKTEVFPSLGDERVPALFDELLRWKTDRFNARGEKTYWENDPRLIRRFLALLERRGEVRLVTVDERTAAILFDFPVGDSMCAQESASDPDLDYYGMALMSDYWELCDALSRGFRTFNMLWGTEDHKARLGAVPRTATALSIFADQRSRLQSLDEAWEVASRTMRRRATARYWRARHAAGRWLRSRTGRAPEAG